MQCPLVEGLQWDLARVRTSSIDGITKLRDERGDSSNGQRINLINK